MAHVMAHHSKAPAVWVKGVVYETAESGISSGTSHFHIRSNCLAKLSKITNTWPWVTAHQKVQSFGFFDLVTLIFRERPFPVNLFI